MLKHMLTGQPSSTAGSRLHHHNDYLQEGGPATSASPAQREHFHPQHQHPHGLAHRGSTRAQSSADVYDSVSHTVGQRAAPQFQSQRHPLNHSQLSVNNLAQRLNASHHSHVLNLSTLSTSKHSVNSASPVVGANLGNCTERRGNLSIGHNQTQALLAQLHQHQHQHPQQQQQHHQPHQHQHQHHHYQQQHTQQQTLARPQQSPLDRDRSKVNGGLDISRASRLTNRATPSPASAANTNGIQPPGPATTTSTGPSIVPLNVSWSSSSLTRNQKGLEAGVKEMLTSLGLLCLVSLLLALLSLTFLIRMSSVSFVPNSLISPEEFAIVYDVTLVLCALALSLNLCCLLVCAIQFLFAVKLVKTSYQGNRTNKYLQKSSISRVCAVGGFFISIPVFLTGMILYTFIQFQSTPAIVTSVFIGLGIVFCGCALVHTVFVWQKEKTNAMKALRREQYEAAAQLQRQQTLHTQQNQHQQQPQQPQPQQTQSHQQTLQHQHQNQQQHQHQHQQQQQQQYQHQHQQQQQQQRSLALNSYGTASRLAGHDQVLHHPRVPQLRQLSSPVNGLHGQLNASQRGQQLVLGPASPPATPGDDSPTNPANKHNRSQQLVSRDASGSVSPGLPQATLDLSSATNTNSPHELSTLV